MKIAHVRQWKKTTDAIAAVRAKVEHDFSWLLKLQARILHLALNEAEALAWQSGFPELIFPTLALEKASHVAAWHEHQKSVQQRGSKLALAT